MKVTNHPRINLLATVIAAVFMALTPAVSAGPNVWTGAGPDGGRATRVLIDPANTDRMYALGAGAGLFVSDDAGATWASLTVAMAAITRTQISDIALDSNAPSTLFVVDNGMEVARSIDGGSTWTQSSTGIAHSLSYLYPHPTTAGTVYATGTGALYKSTDNGDTWSDIGSGLGLSVIDDLLFFAGDSSLVYALGWEGVFKSSDGGATWTQQSSGLPAPNASGYLFAKVGAFDPQDADTVYVNISNQTVFKTVDGGASWAFSGNGVPSDFFTRMVIDPSDNSRIYLGTGNNDVIVSTNAGSSWQDLPNAGLGDYTVDDLAIDPTNPSRMFAATFKKGIFLTTDGGATWARSTQGFVNNNVESLAIDAATGRTYAGVFGGVAYSADGGTSWGENSDDYDLTTYAVAADPLVADHAYAGSSCCGLYETFDGGATWARIDLGLPSVVATWVTDIDIPQSDQQLLFFTDYNRGLFSSADGGQTWTYLTPALAFYFAGNVVLSGVDAVANQPVTIYVSSPDFSSGGVFRSSDGGANWIRIGGGVTSGPARTFSVAAHPTDPDIVFVGTSSGVRYSSDGGVTWQSPSQGFTGETSAIYIDDDDPSLLYAVAQNNNLYRSIDGGDTWTEALDAAGSSRPNALAVDPVDRGRVLVGFDNVGAKEYVFATDLSLSVTATTTTVLPGETLGIDAIVTNNGPLDATVVVLSDAVPAGFAVLSVTPTQGNCVVNGQQIDCSLGVLANAASASVSVTLEGVSPAGGDYGSTVASRESEVDGSDNAATLMLTVTGAADSDRDGVADSVDNCLLVANSSQLDADTDGYGNACDADINNDCIVNVLDLGILKSVFFTASATADFNGDGIVNVIDLGTMKALFFGTPGPAGAGGSCD